MGELFRKHNEDQAKAEQERIESEQREWSAFTTCTIAATQDAVATIKSNGRYNAAYRSDRQDKVISLEWKGDTQLAWNLRDILDLTESRISSNRFVALVETGDMVLVSQVGSDQNIELYAPDKQGLSLDDVGNVFSQLLFLVDDVDFRGRHWSKSQAMLRG